MLPMKLLDQPEHHLRRLSVQIARRLVRQQQLRPRHQRPSQAHPLLLAPAQLARPMPRSRRKSHFIQPDARMLQRPGSRHPTRQQRHRHILQRRKLRQKTAPSAPPTSRFRNSAACRAFSPPTFVSPTHTLPAVGVSSAASRCSSELFPDPLSPTIATISPASTEKFRSRNSTTSPRAPSPALPPPPQPDKSFVNPSARSITVLVGNPAKNRHLDRSGETPHFTLAHFATARPHAVAVAFASR